MKKNLIKSFIITILLTFLFTAQAFGARGDDFYVRVRIRYPRVFNEQTALEGYDKITLYDEEDELFSLNNNLNLRIDTYYTSNYYASDSAQAVYGPYHAVLRDEFYSFEDASDAAEEFRDEFGKEFYPYLTKNGYTVCGGNFTDRRDAEKLAEDLNDEGYDAESMNGNLENIIAYSKNKPVFMYEKDMPVYFSSYNDVEEYEMLKVDSRAYRGKITLKIIDNIKLITINHVELENYLYGVVPNEIPSSWNLEALKAQTLADMIMRKHLQPRQCGIQEVK